MSRQTKKQRKNANTIKAKELELRPISAKTENQKNAFRAYASGKNLLMTGHAGTGKSFLGMFLALDDLMYGDHMYNRVEIGRAHV